MRLQTSRVKDFIKSKILFYLDQTLLYEIGKHTFKYRYLTTREDKYVGAWVFQFYEKVHFLGLVLKNKEV